MSTPTAATSFKGSVCVVGSLNMDLIVRSPMLPNPGQTLLGGDFLTLPGGKGANQAVAAARAGVNVSMVGAVGDDDYGRQMVKVVESDGVSTAAIAARKGTPTGVAIIIVSGSGGGENMIVVAGGANMTLSARDVQTHRREIEGAAVLLMQLETPVEALTEAATIAGNSRATVVLNAAPARELPRELLSRVDVLVVNRSEAAMLGGCDEDADPGRLLEGCGRLGLHDAGGAGGGVVVLTLGAQGAFARVVSSEKTLRAPAFNVKAIDTVAAGDAFVGTLAACLANTPTDRRFALDSLSAAMTLASAAGALATTRQGAIPSLPRLIEIRELAGLHPQCAAKEA